MNYKPATGSRKVRKRVGRGASSGNGKTSGCGQQGQKLVVAWKFVLVFEGGWNSIVLVMSLSKNVDFHKHQC